jgi:hypothetical protein
MFGGEYRSLSSAVCNILWSPIVIFLLEPNTYLSTLFWVTLSPYSSLNMRDPVSQPYNTTGLLAKICIQEVHN